MKIYFQILLQVDRDKIAVLVERHGGESKLKDILRSLVTRMIDEEYETIQRERIEQEISKENKP